MDRELRPPTRPFRACGFALIALLSATLPARARMTIVPDDFPTIQAAVDFLYEPYAVDTLFVRGGDYPERVVIHRGIHMQGIPSLYGSDLIPRINGLQAGGDYSDRYRFVDLHFTGHVSHGPSNGPEKFHFIGCVFDAGMSPGAGGNWPEIEEVRLTRCTLNQFMVIGAYNGVVDSCTVHAPVVLQTPYDATIIDNRCENVRGNVFAIASRDALVARNRVRGGDWGFSAFNSDGGTYRFLDNDIESCQAGGIYATGDAYGYMILERNRIASCGAAGAIVTGVVTARANRVTDCGGTGLEIRQESMTGIIQGNVVGRCISGIWLGYAQQEKPIQNVNVRENTIYGCTGPAIAIRDLPNSRITNNLVYACAGLSATNSEPLTISCNNWFPLFGALPSPSDFSLDPVFCDLAGDDVHLRSDSPLLDMPGCGRIGALGQGCEAPLVTFGLEMWPRVLQPASRSRWVNAALEPPLPFGVTEIDVSSVRVNGVPVAVGTGATVGDRDRDGLPDLQLQFDREALEQTLTAGDGVSVTVSGRVGRRTFSGTDKIRVLRYARGPRSEIPRNAPRDRVLSLRVPTAHGVASALRVQLSLIDESPAELDVLDVAGRVVHSRDVGVRGPGEHTLNLTEAGLPQGIYFLRLRQGTSEARTRMVMIR